MILTADQTKEYILNPQNKDIIDFQVKLKEKHELFITGIGLDKFLTKVDGVENEDYLKVKKKLSNPITIKAFEKVLRPKDKILTAKGGSVIFEIEGDNKTKEKETQLKKALSDLNYKGYSLESYVHEIWLDYGIWVDAMGITMVENVIEEKKLTGKYKISYTSVYDRDEIDEDKIAKYVNYHDFEYTSFDNLEYLILNYGEDTDGNKMFRVIDDETDSLWIEIISRDEQRQEQKKVVQIEDSSIDHGFGKVPAVFNSNKVDKKGINKWFTTYCVEALVVASDYLNDYTDFRIYKKKLGIPRFWELKTKCKKCDGEGQYERTVGDDLKMIDCTSCGGGGHDSERVLTDITQLDLLGTDTQSNIPPSGAVTIPTEIQVQLRKELDEDEFDLSEIIWGQGTAVRKESTNTTAYEISVRNEGKIDKLRRIEQNKVLWEKAIIDLFGHAILGESYKGVIVNPDNQFIVLTPTESRQVYLESKKANSSEPQLTKLWFDYLTAEYENNPLGLERQSKIFLLTPMFHTDIIQAKDYLTDIEFNIKKNMAKYLYRYEHEDNKSIMSDKVSEILESFTKYAEDGISKTKGRDTNNVPE